MRCWLCLDGAGKIGDRNAACVRYLGLNVWVLTEYCDSMT